MRTVEHRGSTGLRIVADVEGPEAGPVVMLLHGDGQNRHAWKGSGAALAAQGYRVVALDARGHGDSQWDPAADYEMETLAADLLAVIEPGRSRTTGPRRGIARRITALETVAALRAGAPRADYVEVRGAGHMVAGDDDDAFTQAVASFLDRHLRPEPGGG